MRSGFSIGAKNKREAMKLAKKLGHTGWKNIRDAGEAVWSEAGKTVRGRNYWFSR